MKEYTYATKKSDKLCNKCILPENYSGVVFNSEGVCNYCVNEQEPHFMGKQKLKEDIKEILDKSPDRKYDCLVGLSGGRDSTYLLWYIVKELNLKPLAVFIDSGYIPEQTYENIQNTVNILNVDLKILKHNYQKRTFKWYYNAWFKRPVPATLVTFCTGCRLGIDDLLKKEARKLRIPLHFEGGTPFEGKSYKKNIIRTNPEKKSISSLLLGYLKQSLLNPLLVINPVNLYVQTMEFYNIYLKKQPKDNAVYLHLFSYIKWQEKVVEATITEKLNWKKYPGLRSNYRGDCEIGIIRQLLYYKLLGYNDKDDHLSCLIRNGQLTRDEALNRIDNEHYVPKEVLEKICSKLGISYKKLEKILSN